MLPDYTESLWLASSPPRSFPTLDKDIEVDYAIVGAGITGVTLAYLLAEEGHRVALLEANQIIHGTTGNTTAKVTVQHDLIYKELIDHFGVDKAGLYYEANKEALHFMRRTASELDIECEWTEQDAYLYAQTAESAEKLRQEYEAYMELGIPGKLLDAIPVPIEVQAALRLSRQAQFHPVKYMNGLIDRFEKAGGLIYENTRIDEKLEQGELPTLITMGGRRITCRHVVASSHFPFYDGGGLYFTRIHPERSYLMAIKPTKAYPGGMYLSVDDPKRSIRSVQLGGESLVIIGGDSHKTGQSEDTLAHYRNLEQFGEQTFGIQAIRYHWSAQDWMTLDKVPYIGQITSSHPNIWVATGYRKWGMTNGTAAALLLKDQLTDKESKYTELFTPSRFVADPSVKNLLIQNFDVAKHLIAGKLESVSLEVDILDLDEGAVVQIDGKRAGAYKDAQGKLHLVDTTCTHMGCELEWNNGERSWDCPCHGSRFDPSGAVIEGPAVQPLQQIEL
ncbi:FAD-dependent oxidoreductase [Paenibacillus sp. S3N08]|uniref:FAD-dependent oxidoreductase n=1 Tax=Paenibacillus agricola TaxID=2716264 RepID=A0ABX0J970_9BACL|nr:FAD-dependent oxidoreductase [Paenibacillus agricola]NHN32992.1 FAD-dependent oxidoreductase [Paenibacillus agricola]